MKKITLLLLLTILILTAKAQETTERKIGLTATIQNSQMGFLIPIWLNNNITIAPAIDFKYVEKIGNSLTIGIVPKYFIKTEKVSPFLSARVGLEFYNPSSEIELKSTTNLIFGAGFGGEYFFDKNLSFGIELQGNFVKSDKNSNTYGNAGGINFNTATLISASVYF